MVEERITTVDGDAAPATHTTVVHEAPRSSGAGMLIAIILVIAVIAGIYLYSQSANSESAKDNAVASAANDVGDAAKKVGDAAGDAVDKAK
jgi:hypothetical protein